jgi:acetolactate synthase-1/3 small subunit
MSTHIISLLVENRHGALSRIANLFSGRGYNISSLTVAATEDVSVSRMTIVVTGDEDILEQIVKQLNKLIDVIKVIDFIDQPIIERELLLIRIDTSRSNRREILDLCDIFNSPAPRQRSTILSRWSSRSACGSWYGRGRWR